MSLVVIPVGFRLKWEFVVFVKDGRSEDMAIIGPRAALKYLREDFGIRSGHQYWTAVSACSGALRYRCDPEIARTCFIVAYSDYVVKSRAR